MENKKPRNLNLAVLIIVGLIIILLRNPILGFIGIIALMIFLRKKLKYLNPDFANYLKTVNKLPNSLANNTQPILEKISSLKSAMPLQIPSLLFNKTTRLEKKKKYLQVALNSTLEEAREIIWQLPTSDRILIEAGTPLIKIYGTEAVSRIKAMAPIGAYIVADSKCADLAAREEEMMVTAGAKAVNC